METLVLQRGPSGDGGTPGELLRNGSHLCFTMELPWKNNQKKISSIPAGKYAVRKRFSIKYGHHWVLEGVEGRDYILIHSGNTIKDIEGCILVGNKLGALNGLPAVLNSKVTMDVLRVTLPDEFVLEVKV